MATPQEAITNNFMIFAIIGAIAIAWLAWLEANGGAPQVK